MSGKRDSFDSRFLSETENPDYSGNHRMHEGRIDSSSRQMTDTDFMRLTNLCGYSLLRERMPRLC